VRESKERGGGRGGCRKEVYEEKEEGVSEEEGGKVEGRGGERGEG